MKAILYDKFNRAALYVKAFKNWKEVIAFRLGYLKEVNLIFRNGFEYKIGKNDMQIMICMLNLSAIHGINFVDLKSDHKDQDWVIDKREKIVIVPQKIKFSLESFTNSTIFSETFLYDIHFMDFDLKNLIIVEAGAFVGDTALYYANKGAKVYSFEPDPNTYKLALKNLELNKDLSKNIKIFNYAIGKDEKINFPINYGGVNSAYKQNAENYAEIRSISIGTILKEFEINKPYLLHLDIKGKEFEVIEDKSIKQFKRIRLEYSTYIDNKKLGSLKYLLDKLRSYGFTKIRVFKHNPGRPYNLNYHGTIDAENLRLYLYPIF